MPGSKFTFVLSFLASAPTAAAPLGNVTVLVFDFNANNCVTVSPQNKATFQAAVRLRSTSTPGSMEIINASLLNGEVGAPYNCQMAAIGGQAPYAWSITMGNLPPGLSLNTATGLISGTPTTAGGYTITARVEDGSPGKKNTTRQLTINVSPAGKLKILIVNMPDGIVGIPYSAAVLVTGGTTPYVFNFSSGTMPDGLKLNSSTGVIDGTLTTQGNYTFSVKVTDAANPANSDIVALTLIVAGAVTVE
jgi:hypothetical protein